MIVHPRFLNISEDETIKFLSDKERGVSIIRPSLKGPTHLMLTLKIFDGVYAHKEIVGGGKDKKDFASYLRLGNTLLIGEETFEDLDEVIDRYVDPLISSLKAILDYRKFRRGTKAEIDDALRKEKYENPTRNPYFISISYEHPGIFCLGISGVQILIMSILGISKGFKFRKKMFDNLDKLVFCFQQHINDLSQQDSLPPIRSVAAMVPMKSPGLGGSAGGAGSVGSGWVGSATNSGGGRDDGWGWSAVDGSKGRDGGWRGSVTNSGGGHDDGWGLSAVYGGKGRDGGWRGSSRDFRCF